MLQGTRVQAELSWWAGSLDRKKKKQFVSFADSCGVNTATTMGNFKLPVKSQNPWVFYTLFSWLCRSNFPCRWAFIRRLLRTSRVLTELIHVKCLIHFFFCRANLCSCQCLFIPRVYLRCRLPLFNRFKIYTRVEG